MNTLLLDRTAWDLCIDASGNIAMAQPSYAIVQDVASACRLFLGELYYGPPTSGIPYFTEAFGQQFPTPLFKSKLIAAALSVPGVTSALCYLTSIGDRTITGQIQVTTAQGVLTVTL